MLSSETTTSWRILLSDTLVAFLGAAVCAALPWAWGGVDELALQAAAVASLLIPLAWLVGGVSVSRRPHPASLAGVGLLAVLAACHLAFPIEPARDAYSFAHQAFIERTRSGCLMPADPVLHASWLVGLACMVAFCSEVFGRRPRLAIVAASVVVLSCLGMAGTAVWMQETGWSPWVEFGKTVSQRPFGFLFHDIIAASWLNLTLAAGGFVISLLGHGSKRLGWLLPALALVGSIVWLQHRHESDAGHQLVWVVGLQVLVGVWIAAFGRQRETPSQGTVHSLKRIGIAVGIGLTGLAVGFLSDSRSSHPIQVVSGAPLHERSTGEDGLIQSDDPLAKQFFGDRRLAWGTGVRMAVASPWIGWGPLGWRNHYPRFTADPLLRSFFLYNQFTHNDCLQFVLEWGIVGLLALALLISPHFAVLLRLTLATPARPVREAGVLICVWAGIAALLVHGQIDFPGQIPAVQAIAAFLLAASSVVIATAQRAPEIARASK